MIGVSLRWRSPTQNSEIKSKSNNKSVGIYNKQTNSENSGLSLSGSNCLGCSHYDCLICETGCFQLYRSKIMIKVTQVKSSGMKGNASSQRLYMLFNMKAQSSNVSKVMTNVKVLRYVGQR